ncbi:MAG TPA: hypothetical protein VM513_24135 [Kofleriaceae bacterium]|jgi:hypothetical protein|nr:hypothetical protein [Kofleriaceae bacterium]
MTPTGLTQLSRSALVRVFLLYAVLATAIVAFTTLLAHRRGMSPHHNEQQAQRDRPAHGR